MEYKKESRYRAARNRKFVTNSRNYKIGITMDKLFKIARIKEDTCCFFVENGARL